MSTRTYDPKKISIIIGPYSIHGFANGTFVEVARDEAAYEKKVGADGEVTRAKSNNLAGTLKIVLDQASPSNDDLSTLATLDETGGAGLVPVLLRDALGSTLVASEAGWVQKKPNSGFSKKAEDREWIIDMSSMDYFVGGHQAN